MLKPNTFLRDRRYRITRLIAKGGMGAIYEAEDLNLKTKVAVKEAQVYEPTLHDAFEKEAQRLARLRHPALPNVIEYFTEQEEQYLVMQFIEGQDLAEMLSQRGQPFPVPQVISWAEYLLDALDYLHQKGVIHRDIKPANIKLTPEKKLILLDFGLSKGGLTQHALSGISLKGYTPGYAPPEQVNGQETDERSDLYSLAATLYILLTKQAPKESSMRKEVMAHNVPDPLRPANELNPQVSSQLAGILARALALEPDKRFESAAKMRSELVSLQSDTAQIRKKLNIAFDDSGLTTFCLDYFPKVHNSFSQGMRKDDKINLLLDHCRRQPNGIKTLSDTFEATKSEEGSRKRTNDSLPTQLLSMKGLIVLLVSIFLVIIFINQIPKTVTTPSSPSSTISETATIPSSLSSTISETATISLPPSSTIPPLTNPPIPTLGIGSTTVSKEDGMTLIYVPEGDFEMGAEDDDPDAEDDEKPRHTVNLSAYWIDQTEVTNEMFAKFLNEMGNQEEGDVTWLDEARSWALIENVNGTYQPKEGFTNHPVLAVSWYGANAYCEWAGRRLPTEAEWEKAARGTDGRIYPWGNETPNDSLANYYGHVGGTTPVGSYPNGASFYGAMNMAGNVWEWVNDFYDENYYAISPRDNPPGSSVEVQFRVVRGGSSNLETRFLRTSRRSGISAFVRASVGGFRCAASDS